MHESFGARLRRQREARGVALEALAKQTRIKESLLEALERDDLSHWPTGFYRRAFFRAYASAIGLDPDVTFCELQQLHPEPPEGDVMAAMAATLGVDGGRGRMGIRSAVESAISSLARLRPGAPADSPSQVVTEAALAERSSSAVPARPAPAIQRAVARERESGVERATVQRDPAIGRESTVGREFAAGLESTAAIEPARGVESAGGHEAAIEREAIERRSAAETALAAEDAPSPERATAPAIDEPVLSDRAPAATSMADIDLEALARLCVELGCVTSEDGTQSLLQRAAHQIGAAGLIVWALDSREWQLQAALAHGYSPRLVAQLPTVRRDDNNATAEAFRSMQTRVFHDSASGKCALAIPLRTAIGCVGVLAVELERGLEATRSRIALATVIAAQLAPIADGLSRPEPLGLVAARD